MKTSFYGPRPVQFKSTKDWNNLIDKIHFTTEDFMKKHSEVIKKLKMPFCDDALNRKVPWTVLSLNLLPFLLDETVQDKTIWFGKKIFPVHWQLQMCERIKQKATQTPEQRSRKDLWKTKDTDRKEQDTGRVALLCWELPLSHSYNFKPHTGESGNSWKVITAEFQQL